MVDVRINGKRIPPLGAIDNLSTLIERLETMAEKNNSALTSLIINNNSIDIDNTNYRKMKLEDEDTVEARIDTPMQLSYESLQVAIDMADLLVFDLKVATLHLWNENNQGEKSLHTLLEDCRLFLTLAAKPIYMLEGLEIHDDPDVYNCLKELDDIANQVENATILAVHGRSKDACTVLVGWVKPSIERWIGLSAPFASKLNINMVAGAG